MAKVSILSERLSLIPFSEEYLSETYVQWLNDPEVVKYSEQRHRLHTLESCREYLLSFDGTPHYFWAIVCHERELVHIGNINAYIDLNNSIADIGILIGNKEYWGKGYGLEAWKAVVNYMLVKLKIRKVTAGTLSNNMGMLKIIGKMGMEQDGQRKRHYLVDGQEVDLVYFCLYGNTNTL